MRKLITREEARALGLKRFFTGKPCRNAHVAERFVSAGACVVCNAERKARWEIRNRGTARATSTRTSAKYRANNRDKERDYSSTYRRKNRDAVYSRNATHRARKLSATPSWDSDLTHFVMQEAADLARRRQAVTGFAWHIDHMVPLQARNACGLHTWSNLQVIPWLLNLAKSNRIWLAQCGEWIHHL